MASPVRARDARPEGLRLPVVHRGPGAAALPLEPPHAIPFLAGLCAVALAWLSWPSFPDAGWFVALGVGISLLVAEKARPAAGARPFGTNRAAGLAGVQAVWLAWTAAAAAAGALGFVLTVAVPGGLPILGYGLVMAIPQAVILHRFLRGTAWWVVATACCWPLAALMALAFVYLVGPLGPLAGGFVLGAVQWLILGYGNGLARAGWWIVASMAGWTADSWILLCGAMSLPADLSTMPAGVLGLFGLAIGAAGGAAYGAISGAALAWLLRERLPATR